ncbi:hypothetical protein [Phenylobacterium sp.]|uniref:hypothetical protein n=1 Tax=Phenylobacterium sp. TaxID=1871053 RepID=UPI00301DBFC5
MATLREIRARTLGPYFEAQLRLAGHMAGLTGVSLGEAAWRYTNFHRRFGYGSPDEATRAGPAGNPWRAYATALEAADGLAAQVRATQDAFMNGQDERLPLPGQDGFGCFACEAPRPDGAVRIHFFNADTDGAGGPLAAGKAPRRRAELARMTAHVRREHPQARTIRGKSWLYNLEAYRRLFPADYVASRTPAKGPLHLTGTSSWGQLIDSREAIRPELRDAFVANLSRLDPDAPWRAFPLRVLSVEAPIESFEAHLSGSRPD